MTAENETYCEEHVGSVHDDLQLLAPLVVWFGPL